MYIGEIMTADCANGIGMRVTVFVSGCRNHCPGCFQPETWDFDYGKLYTPEMEDEIIKELSHPYYDGLTLLGGDPMEESNQEGLLPLLQRIHKELPEKNILAYTGYLYDKDLVPGGRKYVDGVTDRPESFEQLNHVFDRKAPVHGCRCVRGLLFMNSQDNSGKYIDFLT